MAYLKKWQYFCTPLKRIFLRNIMTKKEATKATAKEEKQGQEEAKEIAVEVQLEQDLAQEKDKFLRLFAEFENYKKRTSKERMELYKTANEEMMVVLLPILDDFERGLSEIKKAKDKELLKGMELINNKLLNTLTQKGLQKMSIEKEAVFDVELHEAITQIPAPSDDLKGKIIDVIEQGYTLGDKVIRYPKVVVGQ